MIAGERLSDWLLRQPADSRAYPPGLVWNVPAQREPQAKLKHHLLAQLAISSELTADPAARRRIAEWIETAPVTGRVPVTIADPRWLQAHPEKDPVLDYDHRIRLPPRPDSVTVITDDGYRCHSLHRPGAEALAYLQACQPDRDNRADRIDRAWIVQPDGNVTAFNVASWNAEAQSEPAPGAHIWAPPRDSGWTPRFSALFAEFLATQEIEQPIDATAVQKTRRAAPVLAGPRARDPMFTASDWGVIGLMQTPTARMAETGDLRFHFSRVYPYGRGNVIMQPLEWFEAGFRYTDVSNRLYGPDIAGDQTYKDKSFDFKLRLAKETAHIPQIALGMNDIGGTGMFSSEYLVASKRTGDFDWNLGVAWGYFGGSNNIGNPLSRILGKDFDTRKISGQVGGEVNTASFFRGRTALFGGVAYQTPWEGLQFKAEYDGNDYTHEPQNNNRQQASPINIGLVYRHSPWLDITAGVERGNTLMLGFTFHGRLDKMDMPKVVDPPMPRVVATRPALEPDWSRTAVDIADQTKWQVHRISRMPGELRVMFEQAHGVHWKERIERVAAVLHRDAPADIGRFVLVFMERGVAMTERVILRDTWVADHIRYRAMAERFEAIAAAEPRPVPAGSPLWARDRGPFTIGLSPSYQQTIGGPDGFVLFQAGVATPMELRFGERTWISGSANLRLFDNYDKFKYTAPSNLPRVRTYLREYLTTSDVTLPNLQLTHIGQAGRDQYYSVYAGYLETMFAGAGAEWLYRPWHGPLAFGVDINQVQQRDFKQDLTLRDYKASTGHATLYWDTGWKSTRVTMSAGQYLAGDRGATLEISRVFDNGVALGAWATKTDVSSLAFGEGSFDKGIYINIPFDTMMPASSPSIANFTWRPLTRDGGAKLGRAHTLYGLTNARDRSLTRFSPPDASSRLGPDDEPEWARERSILGDIGSTTAGLGRQLANGQTGSALLFGGGMVLATSLLDRPLSKWADNHQSARWNTLGKAANAIPIVLAAGAGALWLGAGGEMASETAWTSIKSAALTLGAETLMKLAVGRARPEQDLGALHFTPFGKGAANSSFPSIHLGTAQALVTPFAEKYDAHWLHVIAGATAFGRIQQRKHFASDVVAGGLIGYGIGSLLSEQQRQKRGVPHLSLGPGRSVQAMWALE